MVAKQCPIDISHMHAKYVQSNSSVEEYLEVQVITDTQVLCCMLQTYGFYTYLKNLKLQALTWFQVWSNFHDPHCMQARLSFATIFGGSGSGSADISQEIVGQIIAFAQEGNTATGKEIMRELSTL